MLILHCSVRLGEIELRVVKTENLLFKEVESRLMTERSLQKRNHNALIKANPQFHHREPGRDRRLNGVTSVGQNNWGVGSSWIKLIQTGCSLGCAFPADLREGSKH